MCSVTDMLDSMQSDCLDVLGVRIGVVETHITGQRQTWDGTCGF